MKQKKNKYESNDPIYRTIFQVLLFLGLATFFHDPILHGVIAFVNGWEVSDYQTGLMTGFTSVIAPKDAPWYLYWIFFMFPALAIFVLTAIVTFIKPEKSVLVGGIILISLNLPSLNPAIQGSDAYNAVDVLVRSGFNEGMVNILHYLLFIVALAVWGAYLYITIEDEPKDARRRTENIYH